MGGQLYEGRTKEKQKKASNASLDYDLNDGFKFNGCTR